MNTTRRITILATLLLLLGAAPAPALAGAPTASIKRTNAKLQRLLRKKQSEAVKQRLRKLVNGFIDFGELARLSLGKHWDKRSEKERAEFTQTLRDLIEHNYLRQLRSNLDYKVEYRDESLRGGKAKVTTAVKVVKNRRPTEVVITYKMRKAGGTWMVYDVVTDDVSVVRNYRSQFNRIIKKNSFEHLLEKMRTKVEKQRKS